MFIPGNRHVWLSGEFLQLYVIYYTYFLKQILHGEEFIEFVGPIPQCDSKITSRSHVVDVLDKGSGIVAIVGSKLSLYSLIIIYIHI